MSDAITVECSHCHARLKLKSRSAVGKKVPCPKCKKPFVVTAPPEDEDELAFMNVAEPDADEFAGLADGDGEDDDLPPAPTPRGKQRGKKKSSNSDGDMTKWLMVATGSLVAVGLLVVAGIFGIPLLAGWLGSGNKIDTAWLPPDADLVVHARVAETWNSPLLQSLAGNQMIKPQLDLTWGKLGIDPTRVESITFGASGAAAQMKAIATRGVPGMPGTPMGPPPAASAPGPFVIVVRTKEIADLTKIKDKFKNGRTGTHQGAEYLVPPVGGDIALYFATDDTLVTGPEQNVKLAIEWGRKGARRPDLDFVDPTKMVLIALVPKDPSLFDAPAGGTPGGMPGLSATDATRGKVKGLCIGLSATDKLDLTVAANCADAIDADAVLKSTQNSIAESKAKFAKAKAGIPPMFGEFVQLADDILNSFQVSSSGTVVSTRGTVPASVKTAIDKLPMLMMMGAMMPGQNPGGQPGANPFGPPGTPGAQGFPVPGDGQVPGNLPPGTSPPTGSGSLGGPPPGTLPPGSVPPGANLPNLPPPGGNP